MTSLSSCVTLSVKTFLLKNDENLRTLCIYSRVLCPLHTSQRPRQTLTQAEQAELHFVPLKTASGARTALAEELSVELTPTLVVVHEEVSCQLDADGDEDCDYVEQSVERFVGANSIIEHLPATLDAYTYAHPE